MLEKKLSISLLIMRLSLAAFFGAWASLKFLRPEWFENVFKNFYGLEFASKDMAWIVGAIQIAIVIIFAIGLYRRLSYAALALMQAAGVLGSVPNLMNHAQYPNNLMWAAVPALGAVIALYILRDHDRWTVDGWRRRSA